MKKLKDQRFFICNDTLSTISLQVPNEKYRFDDSYEVTMRDCSRQIHWVFSNDIKGLRKAAKVAKFFASLQADLERVVEEKKTTKKRK